jgi:hypothetical protein
MLGRQHRQRKIFSSPEDAILIAKSENACPDDILLEDDIPDDVSILEDFFLSLRGANVRPPPPACSQTQFWNPCPWDA